MVSADSYSSLEQIQSGRVWKLRIVVLPILSVLVLVCMKKSGTSLNNLNAGDHMTATEILIREIELAEREKAVVDREMALLLKEKTATEREIAKTDTKIIQKPEKMAKTNEETFLSRMSNKKRTQIENYRKRNALLLNIHPTHHGGTFFCSQIGRNGINGSVAPAFACMGDKKGIMPKSPSWCNPAKDPICHTSHEMRLELVPWFRNETGLFANAIFPFFHMISWEFSHAPNENTGRSLKQTDWSHPNLMSVIITRDPLSRVLAKNTDAEKKYPGYNTGKLDRKEWWDYALYDDDHKTDNFFLRILAQANRKRFNKKQKKIKNHVKKGINRTTEEVMELFPPTVNKNDFEAAKKMLDRFTIVLDIECLDEGIKVLARMLGLDLPPNPRKHKRKTAFEKKTVKERFVHEDVYEYMVAKNRLDIDLYEYSKTISLVQCENLQ